MHRTFRRFNSVSICTNLLKLDTEFNQINTILNVQNDNLPERPRSDTNTTDQTNNIDETKFLVSKFNLISEIDFLIL